MNNCVTAVERYEYKCQLLSLSPPSLSSSSWLWKGILKSHSFIIKGAYFSIHSFSSLPIWSSSQIPTIAYFSLSPSSLLSHPFLNLLVFDLLSLDPTQSVSNWNIPLLQSLFDTASIREILKINFTSEAKTKLIRTHSSKGEFSTKSVHSLISSQRIVSTQIHLSLSQWRLFQKINLNDILKLFL